MPALAALRARSPIAAVVESALERVGVAFRDQLETPIVPVARLCDHVERYRGKMLRPTLVILSGLATNPALGEPTEEQIVVAAVIEMIHVATLVHDDVLDEATVRRGGDTVNKRDGNEAAIILGDYLLSKAFHLCSTLDTQRTALRVGEVTSVVCEGEMIQLAHRGDFTLNEASYFDIIRRKTAALIGLACELGARHAGADASTAGRLADFGDKIGTAFQIQDDILDLVGDEPTVGKSLGRDAEKGKLTLPLIHHLSRVDPAGRGGVVEALSHGRDGVAGILRELERTGSIEYARRTALRLVGDAKALLAALDESPARGALLSLADAVVARSF